MRRYTIWGAGVMNDLKAVTIVVPPRVGLLERSLIQYLFNRSLTVIELDQLEMLVKGWIDRNLDDPQWLRNTDDSS